MNRMLGALSVFALLAAAPALAGQEAAKAPQGSGTAQAPAQYAPGDLATMGDMLTAAGTVSEIDQGAKSLSLENGMTFEIAEDTRLPDIGEGSDVIVAYQEQNGRMIATRIEPATGAGTEQSAETAGQ